MWLQAVLTADDLLHGLRELTPTRIQLDDEDPARVLHLDPPGEVTFRDGEGALIGTSATLQWDVIGIKVPVQLRSVDVLLIPSIEVDAQGADVLALQARVERLDLSALPGFVEDKLRARINQALENPRAFVRWGFTRTLDFHFHLPTQVTPARDLRLYARWGALRVSEQGFAMAASFSFLADPQEPVEAAHSA
jgi:hypothetical protein